MSDSVAPSVVGRRTRWRARLRALLALTYFVAGWLHLLRPRPFLDITPTWVPAPEAVIAFTGVAEIAGALALAQPRWPALRRAGGVALALYAACVFPANIHHMLIDMAAPQPALGWWYHAPRISLQPALVWLALWVSGTVDWPWRRAC